MVASFDIKERLEKAFSSTGKQPPYVIVVDDSKSYAKRLWARLLHRHIPEENIICFTNAKEAIAFIKGLKPEELGGVVSDYDNRRAQPPQEIDQPWPTGMHVLEIAIKQNPAVRFALVSDEDRQYPGKPPEQGDYLYQDFVEKVLKPNKISPIDINYNSSFFGQKDSHDTVGALLDTLTTIPNIKLVEKPPRRDLFEIDALIFCTEYLANWTTAIIAVFGNDPFAALGESVQRISFNNFAHQIERSSIGKSYDSPSSIPEYSGPALSPEMLDFLQKLSGFWEFTRVSTGSYGNRKSWHL